MNNQIAILYSFEQKCFHIETLREYCNSNILASRLKKPQQFRLFGLTTSEEQAHIEIEKIKKSFKWIKL